MLLGAVSRRAPDRLRQRRQSLHGPRRRAPPRPGGTPRDRRVARRSSSASRWSEAFLVALPAGGLAVILSALTLPLFLRAAPEGIPRLGLVGHRPADAGGRLRPRGARRAGLRRGSRAARVVAGLNRLREGSRGSTGRRSFGRDALVVGQTALALVLLIGSALLVQSFQRLRNVDPGYDTADIYTFQFAPEQARLTDGPSWGRLHLDFMDRLRALPGVTGVGRRQQHPARRRYRRGPISHRGDGPAERRHAARSELHRRRLLPGDGHRCPPRPSVHERRGRHAEQQHRHQPVGGASGCGRVRIRSGSASVAPPGRSQWFTVVGVVEDVKQDDWRDAGEAIVYFPLTGPTPTAWAMGSPAYVVKSPRASSLGREVRDLVRQVAPEAPVYREFTMEFLAQRSMVQLSFTMLTLGVVSALAMILGALGLYGVLSYVRRRADAGDRRADGARRDGRRRCGGWWCRRARRSC